MPFIRRLRHHALPLAVLLVFWSAYLAPLFWRTFQLRPDGIYVGVLHMWSDWPLHLGYARIFATKAPADWLVYNPLFADGVFSYTFLNDAISGLLMRAGVGLHTAFVAPALVETLALCIGLYLFFYLLLRSRLNALLAFAIFFCSSGPGLIKATFEAFKSGGWDFLLGTRELTSLGDYAWYSGNILEGFLLPQRSFVLGLPVALFSMIGVLWVLENPDTRSSVRKAVLLASGIFAGLLPWIHAHSLIAEIILMGLVFMAAKRETKLLLLFFAVPAAILAPLTFSVVRNSGMNSSFFVWQPGWNAKGLVDWLKMWSLQFGTAIPLALAGFWIARKKVSFWARVAFLGFILAFAFTNLFLTQRQPWDNSKIFMWVYLGLSAFSAVALRKLWAWRIAGKVSAILLTLTTCGAGFIMLIYLQRVELHSFRILSVEDQELAERARLGSGPLDRFLTAPVTDSPIMSWAARPILLAFYSWVENYGFKPQDVHADELKIYSGADETPALLRKRRVSFVVIGPAEKNDMKANEPYFRSHYPLAFANQQYKIYDTRSELK